MFLAYIYRSITHRVHFLDKAIRDLFICAKDLFVEATATPADIDSMLCRHHGGGELIPQVTPSPTF
jgi:hypothetical protein